MLKHLVFYDGECGFCDQIVQFIIRKDSKSIFAYASLQGLTAKKLLKSLPPAIKREDTLILIENFKSAHPKIFILGKAALRICWLLGGLLTLPGLIAFLPTFLYNWAYKFVAKHRHKLIQKNSCLVPPQKNRDRFLP